MSIIDLLCIPPQMIVDRSRALWDPDSKWNVNYRGYDRETIRTTIALTKSYNLFLDIPTNEKETDEMVKHRKKREVEILMLVRAMIPLVFNVYKDACIRNGVRPLKYKEDRLSSARARLRHKLAMKRTNDKKEKDVLTTERWNEIVKQNFS